MVMKYVTAIWVCLILLFNLNLMLFAQTAHGGVSIETKAEPTVVRIGDLITFSIIVTRDKDFEVRLPGMGFTLLDSAGLRFPDDALNISDYTIHEPKEVDDKIIERADYIFSPFLVGKFRIASMKVSYRAVEDSSFSELETESIDITVESLKPSETGDIRDIKPPLEIERDIWEIIWPILIAIGGVLLIVFVIVMIKRIRAGKGILPKFEKPPRPPHEVALEELDKLRQSTLLAEGEIKQYYIQLSDIIRNYIEGRFYIIALEMTTTQLIDNMKRDQIEPETIDAVQDFLSICDMVKFAKYKPPIEEIESATQSAYDIVHKTKLVLEEETPEASVKDKSETEPAVAVEEGEPVAESNEGGDGE